MSKKLNVPFEGEIEIDWPFSDTTKKLYDQLNNLGFVPRSRGGYYDEDIISLECQYYKDRTDNNGNSHSHVHHERLFKLEEIKNYMRFPEQRIIIHNNETFVPINIFIDKIKDNRFGEEIIEYWSPDDLIEFSRCGNHFRLKSQLHPDIPKEMKNDMANILSISLELFFEDLAQGYVNDKRYEFSEVSNKIIQLLQNIDINKYYR